MFHNLVLNYVLRIYVDRGLSTEEEFGLGGFNMDGSITKVRSKRFPEKFGKRLNSLMEEREEEAKLINFSQLLK